MSDYDIRKISVVAIVALVVVRLAIGWQLLYEGLWKFDTQKTASPWTAEPYLKAASGPLRGYFRSLTGDPNDLRDLDYATVSARWTAWAESFKNHYNLSDSQRRRLDEMVSGAKDYRVELAQLPPGVALEGSLKRILTFNPEEKRLILDGQLHMTPREKRALLAQVNFVEGVDSVEDIEDPVVKEFVTQVQRLYDRQSRLSYKEQALASLEGDPELAGLVNKEHAGTIDGERLGKIDIYRSRLNRYEEKLANAKTSFDYDHLEYDWKEIQEMRAELVGPIRSLESDMKWQAERLLTTDQLARGPMPVASSPQRNIDLQTMWALTIIGAMLMAGFLTRLAALAGAFLLLQFYLAMPPFPGYPEPPGTEHAVIVNKVFIEVLILAAFVFLPSGRWFGVDAVFSGLFQKKPVDDHS